MRETKDLWADPVAHARVVRLQLIEKLVMKREDMDKELGSIGKAPKGIKDIFHQCRGFEKAFTIAVDVRCSPLQTQKHPHAHVDAPALHAHRILPLPERKESPLQNPAHYC